MISDETKHENIMKNISLFFLKILKNNLKVPEIGYNKNIKDKGKSADVKSEIPETLKWSDHEEKLNFESDEISQKLIILSKRKAPYESSYEIENKSSPP
tara:strand:- start:924 stop:1220 length:297 start_codon:yes stop_codon:yes gene_type:complete